MTVGKLDAALATALARPAITRDDVAAFEAAVNDDGVVSAEEAAALRVLADTYKDRFDPAAATRLATVLGNLVSPPVVPAPVVPAAPGPSPAVVSWDTFSVPNSRDGLAGSQAAEGLETFDQLSAAVTASALSKSDQLLLASSAARVGVMGEAQALRAVTELEALSAPDAAHFKALADAAASPLERAFLFKALGAGYTVDEIEPFEAAIHGWDGAKLLSTLNLADPITDDGNQTGVKQQHHSSCVATTGQALRGEVDPIYALQVRTENSDIHVADEADAFKLNPKLAEEQKVVLEAAGGLATSRGSGWGQGVNWDRLYEVYDARAAQTGFVYATVELDHRPDLTVDTALDAIASQLNKGIPTPLLVGVQWATKCHAMIALEVQGTGPDQRFLIHDPWVGDTMWVKRSEFVAGQAPMGEFQVLGGYHLASPAPAKPVQPVVPAPAPVVPTTVTPAPVTPAPVTPPVVPS